MSDIIIRRLYETDDAHKLETSIATMNDRRKTVVGIFQKIKSMCVSKCSTLIFKGLKNIRHLFG